ncbi:sensor histidine kinase [Clostridium butyricum]|uniref:sensor histidine kinase n=1 Tax=Clostridium butyricum TaxID=1492 RepID=UPI0005EB44BE|nr:HAMP domain-containing sensor histidine kinase [Clostridium butyricum]ALP88905.1 histidine kinase [Clostridium butyricum]ALS15369.1 histidine kinase [Clostridium butyricum]ANF12518.1 two-component sensor histidine kinase [Clostridium butyricum]AOR92587.1 two-component sensor histidine kinase [Clostridium butyricum]MCI3006708.1 HAMP domain-containing histidine kinase [Clostridium butyricum]
MELVKQNQQENIKRKLKTELEGLSKEEVIEKYMDLYENKIAQEDFILNISHDLRSPLSVILGILQCYKNEYDELKAEEHMNIVKRNCYKILKLINNIIDSTKLQQRHFKINRQNIDIINLIEWNISSIDKYAKIKNISLVFDTNVEECIVAVDISSFDRIIMNLISNAIKFSKENSCVFINTWKEEKYITISVKDQGIGIPQNEQKTIFNRFIQSTKNNRNEYSGSGIGLDLVFNLVKAHGGVVELTSTEGLGSEFRIKMPIVKVEDSMKKDKHSMDLSSKVDIFEVEFSDIYV